MHPAIIATIAGLATVFALWLALAVERWTWGKPSRYPEDDVKYHRTRRPPKYPEFLVRGTV
ncbi:MAG: hypothetical protein KAT75_11640, partial [Dehalococcoidia bacterium]|nr:hypothetical protein [Dehalococcoidia bacterium]